MMAVISSAPCLARSCEIRRRRAGRGCSSWRVSAPACARASVAATTPVADQPLPEWSRPDPARAASPREARVAHRRRRTGPSISNTKADRRRCAAAGGPASIACTHGALERGAPAPHARRAQLVAQRPVAVVELEGAGAVDAAVRGPRHDGRALEPRAHDPACSGAAGRAPRAWRRRETSCEKRPVVFLDAPRSAAPRASRRANTPLLDRLSRLATSPMVRLSRPSAAAMSTRCRRWRPA